jgi:hypothetical protein
MIDIRSALATRAESLTSRNPNLAVQYTVYTDDRHDWGILHILNEEDRVIGVEFFETEDSWRRPGAVRDYNIAADEGYPTAVVIPDDVFRDFRRAAVDRGGEGFSTYLYSDFSIRPMMRV